MFLTGLTSGGSLIVAIGAQNAFVMRQGLQKKYLFMTALLCALIDAFLICLGVMGFGQLIEKAPIALIIAKYFAIAFLGFYGFVAMKSALRPKALQEGKEVTSLKKTILLLLGFSLLNPHVYLDTVILLGSIASTQTNKAQFAFGAMTASFLWFFGLTYGSSLLAPLLSQPKSWRFINGLVALSMWSIAASLLIT